MIKCQLALQNSGKTQGAKDLWSTLVAGAPADTLLHPPAQAASALEFFRSTR
jgi:hypothetical protein